MADYKSRGLSRCPFCAKQFDIGVKVPLILTNCGHTICTECAEVLFRKQSIKCPVCRKLIKHLSKVSDLPMNFNIIHECVMRNTNLSKIDFSLEDPFENMHHC